VIAQVRKKVKIGDVELRITPIFTSTVDCAQAISVNGMMLFRNDCRMSCRSSFGSRGNFAPCSRMTSSRSSPAIVARMAVSVIGGMVTTAIFVSV
jgi:hypothetical protein